MRQGDISAPSLFRSFLLLLVVLIGPARLLLADEPATPVAQVEDPFPDRPPAPPLTGGLGWLNSAGPIELAKLKGKVVLLDFWTYCCINCMHILPDLAKLEKEFPNELVVIGVHSAKFEGEQDSENIRDAIRRYEIRHPVVNDAKMAIWRRYGVNSWPTQVLIDPAGRYIGHVSGEGNYETVREVILELVKYHRKKGTLDSRPMHFHLESASLMPTPLLYPGKLLVDEANHRLFVADSGHHRIVVAELASGKLLNVIGTGMSGAQDGPFDQATFHEPQGMALAGDLLYVADRQNHVIRKLDFKEKTVSTIAGTGKQGHERSQIGRATEIPLASPWDLLLKENDLFIAMAGTHQIWRLDLVKGELSPYAGSGRENILDGDWENAQFAQPSGLAADDEYLYVADSETSSIRRIDWKNATVDTIVGQGLFDFGDIDGSPRVARLQHALGLDVKDGTLFVADTYNNKIKKIDLTRRETQSFLGDGEQGKDDEPPRFDEPGDVQVVGNELYIADTNNHSLRVADSSTKKVRTLTIEGLTPPTLPDEESEDESDDPVGKVVDAPAASLPSGEPISFRVTVPVAEGQKLNENAPMSFVISGSSAAGPFRRLTRGRIGEVGSTVEWKTEPIDLTGIEKLRVAVTYFPCETGSEGVCRIATITWRFPVTIAPGEARLVLKP